MAEATARHRAASDAYDRARDAVDRASDELDARDHEWSLANYNRNAVRSRVANEIREREIVRTLGSTNPRLQRQYQHFISRRDQADRELETAHRISDMRMAELNRIGNEARSRGPNPVEHPDYPEAWQRYVNHSNHTATLLDQRTRAARGATAIENRVPIDQNVIDANVQAHPQMDEALRRSRDAQDRLTAAEDALDSARQARHAAYIQKVRTGGEVEVARGGHGVTFTDNSYSAGETAQQAVDRIFGRPVSEHEMIAISGAKPGSEIVITPHNRVVDFKVEDPEIDQYFEVLRDARGQLAMHVMLNSNMGERSLMSDLGLVRQMDAIKASDVKSIHALAARSSNFIGYKVWPKFGFNGPVSPYLARQAEKDLHYNGRIRTVRQLYKIKGGRSWRDKNGNSFDATFKFSDKKSMSEFNRFKSMLQQRENRS